MTRCGWTQKNGEQGGPYGAIGKTSGVRDRNSGGLGAGGVQLIARA